MNWMLDNINEAENKQGNTPIYSDIELLTIADVQTSSYPFSCTINFI